MWLSQFFMSRTTFGCQNAKQRYCYDTIDNDDGYNHQVCLICLVYSNCLS